MKTNRTNVRRPRADSAKGQQAILQSLFKGEIQPPAHVTLRPIDVPFWNDIIATRARVLWNQSDLAIAAELARSKADVESIRAEIEREGHMIQTQKGTSTVNPKHYLLETTIRRVLLLSSKVQVNAEATCGKSRESRAMNQAEQKVSPRVINSELIPRKIQ